MKVLFGIKDKYLDVTEVALRTCVYGDRLIIPETEDQRVALFGDPVYGQLKHIVVNEQKVEHGVSISIEAPRVTGWIGDPHKKLQWIHKCLRFEGDMKMEYPEQIMSILFIKPDDRVLELGSNIGRNTMVISCLLNDTRNLVTLETDPKSIEVLVRNRDMNGFQFKCVNAALSKQPLYQPIGSWQLSSQIPTVPYFTVNCVDLSQLGITPTVLVADCEGSLYNILHDYTEILDMVHTIIVENDYRKVEQRDWVEQQYKSHGFHLAYTMNCHEARYYGLPCADYFFQVWKK